MTATTPPGPGSTLPRGRTAPPDPVEIAEVMPSPMTGAIVLSETPPGPTSRCVPDGTEPDAAIRSCWSPEPALVRSTTLVNECRALGLSVVVEPLTTMSELPLRATLMKESAAPPSVAEIVKCVESTPLA